MLAMRSRFTQAGWLSIFTDLYDYIGERLKLEGETDNNGV